MPIQIETETPAVCQNKECSDYQAFEMYDLDDIFETVDSENKPFDFVFCRECNTRITLQ